MAWTFNDEPSELNRTILEVAAMTDPSFPLSRTSWDEIRPEDYGPEHDFEIYDHGDTQVFWPHSEAALKWGQRYLPDDRWGSKGFVVKTEHMEGVLADAARDNLMSEDEFEQAMNEAEEIQQQWT